MSAIIFKFWFWCFLLRYVRSQLMYTDNNILPEMSTLSPVLVTAVLLPGAVLRCLEPHRRRSAFPKPLDPAALLLEYHQHHNFKKQQRQIQHSILNLLWKHTYRMYAKEQNIVSDIHVFFSLSPTEITKHCLYATAMSEAVKQEESIQTIRSDMKEMGW